MRGRAVSQYTIINADCRDAMRGLDPCSVDSIVTDPPYGLSFMGKDWDHGVPGEHFWREALRVAKPGAHLLAFGGTRTFHRLAVAIEDAGWEIRDTLAWVYGSGFPKSLDVSKAIDKMDASEEQERRRLRFTAWVRSTGATSKQIDLATGTNMGGHYTTAASQPAIMTREHLEACRHLLGDVPEWVEREADIRSVESRNFAEREVVGQKSGLNGSGFGNVGHGLSSTSIPITAPATDAARQWSGWGTALKPAYEPVIVARRPLQGTVAANVLAWGTGAMNVDGCRVGTETIQTNRYTPGRDMTSFQGSQAGNEYVSSTHSVRWPANFIHDGSDEVVGLLGEAARFFYCPKASKADRDEGCEGLDEFACGMMEDDNYDIKTGSGNSRNTRRRNHHPTVKPTDLMRYLCRLVTPPGGVVLDPFMGSGSTGKAAVLEGFRFIGIDLSAEYVEIARARIAHAQHDGAALFAGAVP